MATNNKGFSWIPRILTILIILFIGLLSTDSFNPEFSAWQQLSGFLIHISPALIILLILILAWKRELIGGILFIILSLVTSPFIYSMNYERTQSMLQAIGVLLIISLPILIAGVLFIISYTKKESPPTPI